MKLNCLDFLGISEHFSEEEIMVQQMANKFVINDKAKNTRVISIKILEKEVNIYFFEVLKIIL